MTASRPLAPDAASPRLVGLLLSAVFVVSMGYGVVLPVLPALLQGLARSQHVLSVSTHAGMLSGIYMGALFLLAPVWGAISDRKGRRPVLLLGLAGFALAMGLFSVSRHLALFYLAMILAGGCAAGVLPVVLAWVSEQVQAAERARAMAWISAASALGYFVGPAIGGGLASADSPAFLPFLAIAIASGGVWLAACLGLPRQSIGQPSGDSATPSAQPTLFALLSLSWVTMFSIGAFEVGLALQGPRLLNLGPPELGWLFAECSLVMLLTQLLLVAPLLQRVFAHALWAGCLLMALGLALLPWAETYFALMLVVGLIAGSAGILIPALAFFTALVSRGAPGAGLGRQASASSLGQALGSGLAGWLFAKYFASFLWLPAAMLLIAAGLAVGLAIAHALPESRPESA